MAETLNPAVIWVVCPEYFEHNREKAKNAYAKITELMKVLDIAKEKGIPIVLGSKDSQLAVDGISTTGTIERFTRRYDPLFFENDDTSHEYLKSIGEGAVLYCGAHFSHGEVITSVRPLFPDDYIPLQSEPGIYDRALDPDKKVLRVVYSCVAGAARGVLRCNERFKTNLEAVIDTRLCLLKDGALEDSFYVMRKEIEYQTTVLAEIRPVMNIF